MIKRMTIMLLIIGLVLGLIYAFKGFQSHMIKKYMGSMSKNAQTVSTITARYQVWKEKIEAVGSLRAMRGVDISTEVAGVVTGVYFESGDQVVDGTLLVRLRADDEIAALESLKADADLATLTYNRNFAQLQQRAIAQSVVDVDKANLEKAKATIAQQEAIIAKKFIRAPFTGRLGLRAIDLGEYISPGTLIVTLQALDPIYFDFYLPQESLVKIKLGQRVSVTTNLYPNETFVGKIWAINSKVDTSSRNVQVRAVLDNNEQELLPGMYGNINIDIGTDQKYITLPQTAITYNPYGNIVYIAKPTEPDSEGNMQYIAEQKFVTLGPTRGDQVAVYTGLQPGDLVVTAGQMKLQNGVPLAINNSVLPSNDSNPKPTEY
jgi:membrane fusion protein (multidrug efflux system)